MQPHLKNDLLYLLHILEAAEKIQIYAKGYSDPVVFFDANDGKELNACLMLLVQIGEQAGKISEELKKKYEETDWQKIKGFRNRAVHDYTGLDRFVAFDIVKQYTPILIPAVSAIIREELAAGNFDKEEFFIATGSPYLKHVDFSNL